MHRRFPSIAARTLLACVPALGLVMAVGASTASAARTPVNGRAAAIRALEHLMIGHHPLNHLVGHAVAVKGAPTRVQSSNWSGYADTSTSSKYVSVTGSWIEPKATCTSTASYAAFWVGIDGYSSTSVEQQGTLIECLSGTPHYFTWWEMYPSNAIQIVGSTVKPGDHISASTVKTGTSSYKLTVTDSTTPANSFTTTQTCAATTCVDSSAEWIAEAPSSGSGVLPLAKFSLWTLNGATVKAGTKSGTISSFPDSEITMVNSAKKVKAQPGPLNATGNQFTVTWKSAI